MNIRLLSILLLLPNFIIAQTSKKPLDHSTYDIWNTIRNVEISNDGQWITYQLQPGQGDPTMRLYNKNREEEGSFERSKSASFSWNSDFIMWSITPPLDSMKAMRRRKAEKEDLPKDTLAILNLSSQKLEKIPNVKKYTLPAEWSGHVAYLLDPVKMPEDTTLADSLRIVPKPNNEENGYTLVLRNLETAQQDTFKYVVDYSFSKFNQQLVFQSKGDSTFQQGIYRFDCKNAKLHPLCRNEGQFERLIIDEHGENVAFLADFDTTKHTIRYPGLYYWNESQDSAHLVLDTISSFVPSGWLINAKDTLFFSENGEKLFFGISPKPSLPDTTLLEEEIVNVEIWNYKDQRLHTQQNIEVDQDKKKAFRCWFDTKDKNFIQLATEQIPDILTADKGNADIAIGLSNEQYQKLISWEGFPLRNDVFRVEMQSGKKQRIAENLRSYQFGISPKGNYFYWIDTEDSCWYSYSISTGITKNLTKTISVPFTDELNDAPTPPYPYGIAGWTKDDQDLLIYDRYDLWRIDPKGENPPKNLTNGRSARKVYRYLKLDHRERWIDPKQTMLLHTYNELTRDEGYALLDLKAASDPKQVMEGPFSYSSPIKALYDDQLIYTKESFQQFPDLLASDLSFKTSKQISNANPQQDEYLWGSAEIVQWTSLDGEELEGMLFKPENFNPSKKYPMIVNFY